jgi:DNA-binding response OmpR family regulator
MRILVVADEFERAGLLVERLRRSRFEADRAATPIGARPRISRPREHLNDERAGVPIVPVRGVGYTLAKSAL